MALLENLSKKLGKTGQDALQKTKDLAETAKLYSQISDLENKINNCFIALGKEYFNKYKDNDTSEFIILLNEIKQYYININNCNEDIRKIKGEIICPKCNKTIKKESTFCSNCGEQIINQVDNTVVIKEKTI
ncbi:zinc ribbon domain-containing protein [uncultured Thomasclavelia sp.]|uniref:zinc ribbon domain-containing protein n=1 Tax=uncultured Thomasclavelia sp. TaxID=3025759 RepID=UPI00280C04FF|nr:zinc ribbon domain-containing protein [uncultured Thomasclavelia sp.]